MILNKRQTIALDYLEDDTTRFVLFGGGAGSSKSFLGAYWLVKNCLKYPETRWLLGRARITTLKRTSLLTVFEICKLQGLKPEIHYRYNGQANTITFFNGSVIFLYDLFLYPTDPLFDKLGGLEITGALIEEVQEVSKQAVDVVSTRIRYKLQENGLIPKILMTCNPSKSWSFKEYYLADKEGTLPPHKKFVQALAKDNPFVDPSYIQQLSDLPQAQRDRLRDGKWEGTDDRQLINQENINNLFTNTFVKGGNKYITIDVARQGKDKSVIMVWDGLKVIDFYEYNKNTLVELTDKIKELHRKYTIPMSNIIADETGVGAGVVDTLRCKGFLGGSKALNGENYLNLRTQCFYRLATIINSNSMYMEYKFPQETILKITEELEQVMSADTNEDGKLRVISKDDIKNNIGRSPDYSDTLSMRMYFELNKNTGIYSFV